MYSIRLQSSEGEIIKTTAEVAKISGTIKTLLEDCGIDEDSDAIVPLPNVNTTCLKKFLEWAEYHKNDVVRMDEANGTKTNDISPWDLDFFKVDQGSLLDLVLAANYLDVKPLMEVACKTVANMIKGKTPEDIRKVFNIENDFSPDKREEIRKENKVGERKK